MCPPHLVVKTMRHSFCRTADQDTYFCFHLYVAPVVQRSPQTPNGLVFTASHSALFVEDVSAKLTKYSLNSNMPIYSVIKHLGKPLFLVPVSPPVQVSRGRKLRLTGTKKTLPSNTQRHPKTPNGLVFTTSHIVHRDSLSQVFLRSLSQIFLSLNLKR